LGGEGNSSRRLDLRLGGKRWKRGGNPGAGDQQEEEEEEEFFYIDLFDRTSLRLVYHVSTVFKLP
ncbi:MAG: hypothetical protein KGZ42_09285, partial [Melioribacter sp.]|nr:hypothetical protein [Melioribacter sp.]